MSWAQEMSSALVWTGITLALIALARHPRLERRSGMQWIAIHLNAVAAVIVARAFFIYGTDAWLAWYPAPPEFSAVLMTSARNNFIGTWLLIGVAHAIVQFQRAQASARRIAELEAVLATARLHALRAQLNPHFLFNALNSVAEMVHRDADLTDRMLVSISELLRESLSPDQRQQRPLRNEIELVRNYLMIEKIRLGERLEVDWQLDERCLDVPVPVLILQPLVENAIVHAIARRREPSVLAIRAKVSGSMLVIEVANPTAPGEAPAPGAGIGLGNARGRLQLLHGDQAQLTRQDTGDRFSVELRVPIPKAGRRAA